uniref:ARAD1B19998p n=1 Tax=Blastobotrys adeninivorans TaxID=409370 RepID=A0A060T6M1_BLAAD
MATFVHDPLLDDDDGSSSDESSFLPPVLSNYARELLSSDPKGPNSDPKLEPINGSISVVDSGDAITAKESTTLYTPDEPNGNRPLKLHSTPGLSQRTFNRPIKSRILQLSRQQKTDDKDTVKHSPELDTRRIRFATEKGSPTASASRASSSNSSSSSSSTSSSSLSSSADEVNTPRTTIQYKREPLGSISPNKAHVTGTIQKSTPPQKRPESYSEKVTERLPSPPRLKSPERSPVRASSREPRDHRDFRGSREASYYSNRNSSSHREPSQRDLIVNGRAYQRMEVLGRGGSSKVYKAKFSNRTFAVKIVTFDDLDDSVIEGYKGEIRLLKRLRDEERVVKLMDYEMLDSRLLVVMECGEIDLAHVLAARVNQPLDLSFVRYYSVELLKCVSAVHKCGIVHSDLKPANFLLVKGMLKIIDFGIANVVPDNTINVHRDCTMGTPNYMAPEMLTDIGDSDRQSSAHYKVGKAADVWSCGCIMYQMIYGRAPFANFQGHHRMAAIVSPQVEIQFPRHGLGQVKVPKEAIETIAGCLRRKVNDRYTIERVLNGPFLNPQAVDRTFIKSLIDNAIRYGAQRGAVNDAELDTLLDEAWKRIQARNM